MLGIRNYFKLVLTSEDIFLLIILTQHYFNSLISFTFAYDRLNSKNAKDFLEKSVDVMPFEIKGIQTDNGGEFTKTLKKKEIKHYFNYPRYPKGQAYIERMNRTLQEEFVMYYEDCELEDIHEFNKKMLQYMLWYNIERPHHSLTKNHLYNTFAIS